VTAASSDIYDALAPHYREYAAKKSSYLAAVDRFILEHAPSRTSSMLDVGSGDGIRAMALANKLKVPTIILSDYSREMAERCRALRPTDVWQTAAQDLPKTERRFDVITCLWNVLGHLPDRSSRILALTHMKDLLSENGIIFFDVNNRHNAAAYGWLKVLGRIVIDTTQHNDRRGDASFDWTIGDKIFPAMGHLFTPMEIQTIVRESGLRVLVRAAIDYTTGVRSHLPLRGQLVYAVAR